MPKPTFLGKKKCFLGKKEDFLRVNTENIKKGKKFSSGCERNPDDDGDCQSLNMMDYMLFQFCFSLHDLHFYPQLWKHSKVLLESAYNLTKNLCEQYITRYV